MAELYKNFIYGRWVEARSGRTFENRNPANRNDLVGLFPASGLFTGLRLPIRRRSECKSSREGPIYSVQGTRDAGKEFIRRSKTLLAQ